jgi:hypothetical protein
MDLNHWTEIGLPRKPATWRGRLFSELKKFIFNMEHANLKIQHLQQATKDKKEKDTKVVLR